MDSDGGPGDDPCGGCVLLDGRLAHLADQARVLDAERAARRSAETLAARLVQLQALTAALSQSACLDEVVQATLAHGPPALGADGAILYLHGADRTRLDLVGQSGFFITYDAIYRSIRVDDESLLVPSVARTGQPLWIEDTEDLRLRAPVSAEHAIAIGMAAVAVLPLRLGERALGAIIMGFHASRRFTDDERSFALTAADQCAQAFDRVLAHARAARAAARMSLLQEVTSAFSEARSPADVAAVALTQGCAAVVAPRGLIALAGEDRASLAVAQMVGYPPEVVAARPRIPLDLPGPFAAAFASREALFFATAAEALALYPRLAPQRRPDDSALAVIPLVAGGRALGVLGLVFPEPHPFDEEDRAFLQAFGRQCAQALDRAQVYEAEARARAAAEGANLAKDDFLSTLSHELRTPLTSILGWANILRTRHMEPAATARAVATIERNARAQVQLVEDILDVSRIVAGKLRIYVRRVEPVAIVRAAIEVVRPAAEARRILVTAALDAAVGTIVADPERLQQIALNLLTNAVKFSPAGGVVRVSLEAHGDGVRLEVVDHGEGIDPQFLRHVFERFRQGDASQTRPHGGLGLGLAISRHLVELHHGTLTAASAGPGLGATFTVTLPRAPPGFAAPDSTRSGDPVTPVPSRLDGVLVVVVEDKPDTRELLAEILERNGASVTLASSAREGLAAVERVHPHVLVTDIGMPGEDGYALLRRVRALPGERERRVAALALTAYAGPEAERRAELAGFQAHLAKPVLPGRLVDEVARLAALPRPVEPSLAT